MIYLNLPNFFIDSYSIIPYNTKHPMDFCLIEKGSDVMFEFVLMELIGQTIVFGSQINGYFFIILLHTTKPLLQLMSFHIS